MNGMCPGFVAFYFGAGFVINDVIIFVPRDLWFWETYDFTSESDITAFFYGFRGWEPLYKFRSWENKRTRASELTYNML